MTYNIGVANLSRTWCSTSLWSDLPGHPLCGTIAPLHPFLAHARTSVAYCKGRRNWLSSDPSVAATLWASFSNQIHPPSPIRQCPLQLQSPKFSPWPIHICCIDNCLTTNSPDQHIVTPEFTAFLPLLQLTPNTDLFDWAQHVPLSCA